MDYSVYKFKKKEIFKLIFLIVIVLLVVAKLFYGNFASAIVLSPVSIGVIKIRKNYLVRKRREDLAIQFKDMLESMADSMIAGCSTVNALRESYKEMVTVYGPESYICQELRIVISRIKLNIPLEEVFTDLAERSQIEDIKLFVTVFAIAQRKGGNMVTVIKSVADNIAQKSDVKEDILVCINEKKMEEKIMSFVPLIVVLYMIITSPGFLEPMYETWTGRIVMTVCLVAYAFAYAWAEKIMSIEV